MQQQAIDKLGKDHSKDEHRLHSRQVLFVNFFCIFGEVSQELNLAQHLNFTTGKQSRFAAISANPEAGHRDL